MTTRRSLFGLIAGALFAPVLAKAAPRTTSLTAYDLEAPAKELYPVLAPLGDIDAMLKSQWDTYRLNPEVIYFNGTWGEYDDLRRQFRRAMRRAQMEGLSDVQA